MKIIKKIAVLLLGVFLFSGCSDGFGTDQLITPPKLTTDQSELFTALETAIGSDSFKLKYPLRGDYRSAFVLKDIDLDGEEEAIAFYEATTSGVSSTWLAIMTRDSGEWYPAYQIPSEGTDIDFISFLPITSSSKDNVIIGYSDSREAISTMAVYDYNEGDLTKRYQDVYHENINTDFNGDGLEELILINHGDENHPAMKLVGYYAGEVRKLSEIILPSASDSFKSVGSGFFAENLPGIYVDIVIGEDLLTTILATVEGNKLTEIYPEDLGFARDFDRRIAAPGVRDIDNDGYLEFPIDYVLNGYDEGDENPVFETRYYSIVGGTFTLTDIAIANYNNNYLLTIPPSWWEIVTVIEASEPNEWSFNLYAGTLEDSTAELLRIKAVGPGDYVDQFDTTPYEVIATRGNTEYRAYIPENAPEDLAVTMSYLKENFSFL